MKIDAKKLSEVRKLHAEIIGADRMTLQKSQRVGEILSGWKTELGHGEWETFVKEKLPFSPRSARIYIAHWTNRDLLKSAAAADLKAANRVITEHHAEETGGGSSVQPEPIKFYLTHVNGLKQAIHQRCKKDVAGLLEWIGQVDVSTFEKEQRRRLRAEFEELIDFHGELTRVVAFAASL